MIAVVDAGTGNLRSVEKALQAVCAPRRREVLRAVYHVFDVARLPDGRLVASTGAYPVGETAYFSKHAPAALFVDDVPGSTTILPSCMSNPHEARGPRSVFIP